MADIQSSPASRSRGRAIGAHVRFIRNARGLTSAELARRAGISKAALSSIEAGGGNPTIGTLDALAAALALPLADLVNSHGVESPVKIPGTEYDPHAPTRELLRRLHGSYSVEIWKLRVPPEHETSGAPHAPGTVENLVVASGELRAGADSDLVDLVAGDCLSFAGDQPHSYITGRSPADVTVIIASPQYPSTQM
ncbi:XRE family transcriptional regulator [Actinopolyspora mortivallis]|uniref:XRE family transcriptional regulator n=1 Tax=Actinopolyspora mortivallis TaxID=33906 RepID=UPI001C62603D|nr:XRE family transcriptional regulator [Actinopolyspora mortivallis]